ncbi:hypothetical protein HanIR_Chr04g0207711 [Helianthus annuus]|nr:hypothetical protein HanIR_Chr04g0207711 [Helianthus annuus]
MEHGEMQKTCVLTWLVKIVKRMLSLLSILVLLRPTKLSKSLKLMIRRMEQVMLEMRRCINVRTRIVKEKMFSRCPGFKIPIRVQDSTSTVTLILFGHEALKFVGKTAKELL